VVSQQGGPTDLRRAPRPGTRGQGTRRRGIDPLPPVTDPAASWYVLRV